MAFLVGEEKELEKETASNTNNIDTTSQGDENNATTYSPKTTNNNHTFILCTYKESEYLEDCIKSLKNQTVDSDIIISTSTPNDFVDALASKYEIPVFTHNVGGSIGKDWNYGWTVPKTKYVTITHQDDIYLPEFLEENLKHLESSPNSLVAFTNYHEIDKDSNQIPRTTNLKIKDIMLLPFNLLVGSRFIRNRVMSLGSPICTPAVTYVRKELETFKFSETITACVDWDAYYRINKLKGKWYYSSKRLVLHRIHTESETSNTIQSNKRTQEEYEMFSRYWPQFIVKILMKFYVKAQNTNNL